MALGGFWTYLNCCVAFLAKQEISIRVRFDLGAEEPSFAEGLLEALFEDDSDAFSLGILQL